MTSFVVMDACPRGFDGWAIENDCGLGIHEQIRGHVGSIDRDDVILARIKMM